jgi:hypothetical protein
VLVLTNRSIEAALALTTVSVASGGALLAYRGTVD